MNLSILVIGLLPLIIFAVVDSLAGPKWGIISAIAFALLEIVFSLTFFGHLDGITALSVAFTTLFGLLGLIKKSPLIFKLSPAGVEIVLAVVLILSWSIDRPLFTLYYDKYREAFMELITKASQQANLPAQALARLHSPQWRVFLTQSTLTLGVSLFLHGIIVAFCAWKYSKWVWLASRLSLYFFLITSVLIAQSLSF